MQRVARRASHPTPSAGPDQKHDPARTSRGRLRRKGFGKIWFRLLRVGRRRRLARGLGAPAISAHASRRSASSSACRRYAATAAIHASKPNASNSESDTPRASRTIIYTGNSRQGRRFLDAEAQDRGYGDKAIPGREAELSCTPATAAANAVRDCGRLPHGVEPKLWTLCCADGGCVQCVSG
jgi:hypothetical protein